MKKRTIILFFPLLDADNTHSNFPWALLYLERMIRDTNLRVILIDERFERDYTKTLEAEAGNLLFAGISAMAGYQVSGGIKFFDSVRKFSDAPVIWGGWFPTVFPEMLLKDGYADYVCIGQGEIPFQSFTKKMIAGEKINDIPGIGFLENGYPIIPANEKLVNDSEFPAYDLGLIDINKLIDINGKVEPGNRGADYLATTGCPYDCSFCNLALVFGRKWFAKKIPMIIADITYFVKYAEVSHITFSDDNFFAGKAFVMDLCKELIRKGLSITWEANAHVGSFLKQYNNEDITLLYESGCRRIKVGAESGDQRALDLLKKNISVDDNLQIVRLLKKHNIHIRYFTMICFPSDPDRDFRRTMNMIGRALLIDKTLDANVNFYKPIPKTALYELCKNHGFEYPENISGLLKFFSGKFHAPWYHRDYEKLLDNYLNFYFLFTDPSYYKKFPIKTRPLIFILNGIIFPCVYLRFKLNCTGFHIGAKLFKNIVKRQIENSDALSVYRTGT